MLTKYGETLRWIFLICYVVFSVIIYVTHLIQINTPLAMPLLICLAFLLLVGFKLTEKKNGE